MSMVYAFVFVILGMAIAKYGPIKRWEDFTRGEQMKFERQLENPDHVNGISMYKGPTLPKNRWRNRITLFLAIWYLIVLVGFNPLDLETWVVPSVIWVFSIPRL